MRDTKLILVDGMPGTGKSSTSQFIHRQLCASGRQSQWFYEDHADHPVRLFYDLKRHSSWSDYCNEAVQRWRGFVDGLHGRNEIVVIDTAILQNHFRSMLIFDCDRDGMLDVARKIDAQIARLGAVFVYLKPESVEANFRDIVSVRGQRMQELWLEAHDHYPYTKTRQLNGYSGFIKFWEEFAGIAEQAFNELAMSKICQSVSASKHKAGRRELLSFLGLPALEEAAAPDLHRFAGKYSSARDHNSAGFTLRAKDGCLVAAVDEPAIDVRQGPIGCFREVRLVPTERNRFYIEAWPHEVHFTEDATGAVLDMRVKACDGCPTMSRVYVKE